MLDLKTYTSYFIQQLIFRLFYEMAPASNLQFLFLSFRQSLLVSTISLRPCEQTSCCVIHWLAGILLGYLLYKLYKFTEKNKKKQTISTHYLAIESLFLSIGVLFCFSSNSDDNIAIGAVKNGKCCTQSQEQGHTVMSNLFTVLQVLYTMFRRCQCCMTDGLLSVEKMFTISAYTCWKCTWKNNIKTCAA